ncbi:hypothetical protein BB560_004193 [Smittium megazygosporum]|uniref:Mitochondrial distribution and morphology protein 10 n=1 Tax=Smittium megazygosporum TaxID=133381 RepID=A0A2T9Z9X5_9FUNG|nr:hypothetical protein BB560_004193 [Smittium megazygosporum]
MELDPLSIDASVQRFYDLVGWDCYSQYPKFLQATKDILSFNSLNGICFSLNGQKLSNFKSEYTLGLSPAVSGSVSYLASSYPIPDLYTYPKQLPSSSASNFSAFQENISVNLSKSDHTSNAYYLPTLLKSLNRRTWENSTILDLSSSRNTTEFRSQYLLAAQAYLNLKTLSGMYLNQISKEQQFKLDWLSIADKNRSLYASVTFGQYSIDKGNWASAFSLALNTGMIGLNGVYHINGNFADSSKNSSSKRPKSLFSVGSEIYYCITDSSGGLSLGLKSTSFNQKLFYESGLLFSPIMGHLKMFYCQQVSSRLFGATSFDYNYYSSLSQLDFGLEYWGKTKTKEISSVKTANVVDNSTQNPFSKTICNFLMKLTDNLKTYY